MALISLPPYISVYVEYVLATLFWSNLITYFMYVLGQVVERQGVWLGPRRTGIDPSRRRGKDFVLSFKFRLALGSTPPPVN